MMANIIDTLSKPDILSLICFTFLFGMSIAIYGIYMVKSLNKNVKEKNGEDKKSEPPPSKHLMIKPTGSDFWLSLSLHWHCLHSGFNEISIPGWLH